MYVVKRKEKEKTIAIYTLIFSSIRKAAGPASTSIIMNRKEIITANKHPSTLHPFP